MFHNLRPEDRPDLVSRLFKIKLNHLIKEIKKGKIFGKVRAGNIQLVIYISNSFLYGVYQHIIKLGI